MSGRFEEMAVDLLFDTGRAPRADHSEALAALFTSSGLPIDVSFTTPQPQRVSVHSWALGARSAFVARGEGLRLARGRRELRAAAPDAIRVGYQVRGDYRLLAGDHGETGGWGRVTLIDQAELCEFSQSGRSACVLSLDITYDELRLPRRVLRAARPALTASPVYSLLQAHLSRLTATASARVSPTAARLVGASTVELVRAAVAALDPHASGAPGALQESLRSRIVEYAVQHVCERDLTPQRLAQAHHISLRHLYSVWGDDGPGVWEWIVRERLERALAQLADPAHSHRTIAAIAHDTGFTNAAHFTRRFVRAYGLVPRDWRAGACPP